MSISAGASSVSCDSSQAPSSSIVSSWLKFLELDRYTTAFLDNGYDELETVKQIGPEDLDAIGVSLLHHRDFLLDAVQVLQKHGATWVYLLQPAQEQDLLEEDNSERNHSGSSGIASLNSSSLPWSEDREENSSSLSSSSSCRPKSSQDNVDTNCQGNFQQKNYKHGLVGQPAVRDSPDIHDFYHGGKTINWGKKY